MFSRTHVETIRSEPLKRRPLLWLVMHNGPTFRNTVAHFMHDLGLIPVNGQEFLLLGEVCGDILTLLQICKQKGSRTCKTHYKRIYADA